MKAWLVGPLLATMLASSAWAQAPAPQSDEPPPAEDVATDDGVPPSDEPISVDDVARDSAVSSSAAPAASAADDAEAPSPPVALGEMRLVQIAVYDLEMADDARLGRLLTDQLVVELRKLSGASVIGMTEIKAMLDHEAAKSMVGCEEDESCLADIAGALGVDVIVIGSIGKVGNEHVVGMRRIDQRNAQVAGQFQQRITDDGTGQALMASIGPAVETMFADLTLREGEQRGVSEAILYRLDPPPLPAWAFWSSVVVTGGLLAGAAGLMALNGGAWLLHSSYYQSGLNNPVSYDVVQRNRLIVDVTAYAALGVLALGVASGAGTGVMAFFTDFVGAQPGEEER